MTTVTFYEVESREKLILAAKLAESFYQQKKTVLVLCDDKDKAIEFDELLWSFNPTSFVPHNLVDESLSPPPPVLVGFLNAKNPKQHIVINLSHQLIENYPQEIIELVSESEEEKIRLRGFFKTYRQKGFLVHFKQQAIQKV